MKPESKTAPADKDLPAALANKKKIVLDVEVQPNAPTVFADQPKFKQVMYNLLSNAIKFTPDGGRVAVRASVQEGDSPSEHRGGPSG